MSNVDFQSLDTIISISKRHESDLILLSHKMQQASTGERMDIARAIEHIFLADDPNLDKVELRYFIDIVTSTIAYQVQQRTEHLQKVLGSNGWYRPVRQMQREWIKNNSYDFEMSTRRDVEKLHETWKSFDCAENKEVEQKLSYVNAFANAHGSRQIVAKDIESSNLKEQRKIDQENERSDLLNNLLEKYGGKDA